MQVSNVFFSYGLLQMFTDLDNEQRKYPPIYFSLAVATFSTIMATNKETGKYEISAYTFLVHWDQSLIKRVP